MKLRISRDLLERISDHGRAAYPYECCGVLLGQIDNSVKSVADVRPMSNSREDSLHNRYLIAPQELLEIENECRRLGMDIVGFYHSHPDHPARPSEFDREHAFPWYSYVIISVVRGEPGDLASWTLRDDRSAFESE